MDWCVLSPMYGARGERVITIRVSSPLGPGPLLLLLFGNLSVVIFFLRLFESSVCKSIYSLTFSS